MSSSVTRGGGHASREPSRQGGFSMPRYQFLCEKCKNAFELIMTIAEREKAQPKCPTCADTKVVPQFSGFVAQTKKKS